METNMYKQMCHILTGTSGCVEKKMSTIHQIQAFLI